MKRSRSLKRSPRSSAARRRGRHGARHGHRGRFGRGDRRALRAQGVERGPLGRRPADRPPVLVRVLVSGSGSLASAVPDSLMISLSGPAAWRGACLPLPRAGPEGRARLWGRPQARSPEGEHLRVGASAAEEEGFEPTVPLRVRRFSKPVPSAARPLLREFRRGGRSTVRAHRGMPRRRAGLLTARFGGFAGRGGGFVFGLGELWLGGGGVRAGRDAHS